MGPPNLARCVAGLGGLVVKERRLLSNDGRVGLLPVTTLTEMGRTGYPHIETTEANECAGVRMAVLHE